MKQPVNLIKELKKLNDEYTYENDPLFDFVYRIEEDTKMIYIYDSNEAFHYNFDEDMACLEYDAAKEFGYKPNPKTYESGIVQRIETALKKDYGKHVYVDWETNVAMSAYIGKE